MSLPEIEQARAAHRWILEFQRKVLPVPLSDAEVVTRALHLVNDQAGSELSVEEIQAGEFAMMSASWGLDKVQIAANVKRLGDRKVALAWWKGTASERAEFRSQLELCIENPKAARAKFRENIIGGLRDVVAIPELEWVDETLRTSISYYPSGLRVWFAYILARVLDKSGDIGKALRVCKLCNRMFLSFPPASGGPRPSYCRPEHRLEAGQLTASIRTAQWRERQKKARKPK